MDMVYEACRILKQVLQARAPYKTGNLAMNSIRVVGNAVYIGGEIAPYAPFTNEPWKSEKRQGKKNPNEGWIRRAIEEATPIIQRVLSGHASDEDVKSAIAKYQSIYEERKKHRIELLNKKKETIK